MTPAISFVVTARDEDPAVLAATIDGLLETSACHSREVVVIDDGSTVPVACDRPGVLLVRHPEPVGVARSRRHGAAIASGEVLGWVDAHMRFAPDWLDHMLEHVGSGALLCAAWWNYDLTRPLCWGADFDWCADRDYQAGRSPGLAFRHRTKFPGDGAVDVPMVIGACYMALRGSYDALGGFSPFFRIWGKAEQDVSARAWISGVGVKCVTAARAGHLSRKKFPYPVSWRDIEFNSIAMARTVFDAPVAAEIERGFAPLHADVETWLAGTDFREWRALVQSRRTISDAEFLRRFVPNAPAHLMERGA
ncbi:MAG TPA: glycosyltransferase [Vicinamibacteria bacterium]|nr:glycosyltransferase [Vicinamibacteria bacterium]